MLSARSPGDFQDPSDRVAALDWQSMPHVNPVSVATGASGSGPPARPQSAGERNQSDILTKCVSGRTLCKHLEVWGYQLRDKKSSGHKELLTCGTWPGSTT